MFQALDHETPTADLDALAEIARETAARAGASHVSVALEVGTWTGRTALVLAEYFDVVFCVDHFLGNAGDRLGPLAKGYGPNHIFATLCKNLDSKLCRTVFPCVGFSRMWADVWQRPLDLVWIDGGHDYEDVFADIAGWSPHIRSGGVICGHDHGVFPGVTRAVDEFFPTRSLAGQCVWWKEVP